MKRRDEEDVKARREKRTRLPFEVVNSRELVVHARRTLLEREKARKGKSS